MLWQACWIGVLRVTGGFVSSPSRSWVSCGPNRFQMAWDILNAINVPSYNFIICESLVMWEVAMNFWGGTKVKRLYQVLFNHMLAKVTFTPTFKFLAMKWAPFFINCIWNRLSLDTSWICSFANIFCLTRISGIWIIILRNKSRCQILWKLAP